MTNKISDKDKKDWEKFITSEEKVIDKDSKSNLKTRQKSKYIDLHGYTLEEANIEIEKLFIFFKYDSIISFSISLFASSRV